MKKIKYISVAAILIITSFLVIQKYIQQRTPVTIGYIGSLTGMYSEIGKTCRDGALLAIEEINKNGGINGRPLQVIIGDSKSSPEIALQQAKLLAKEKVKAIIGPSTSSEALKIINYINKNEILTIGPVVASDLVAGKKDFFFKMYPSSSEIGSDLGKLAVTDRSFQKLAVTSDLGNEAYAGPVREYFIQTVEELGSKVVSTTFFKGKTPSPYVDLVKKILAKEPDALLIIAGPLHAAMIMQQVRMQNSDIQFFTTPWSASQDMITGGGMAVEGLLFYLPYTYKSSTPKQTKFSQNYEERFAVKPNICAAFNYEAMIIMANALRNCDCDNSAKLREHIILASPYEGLQGKIRIDENGDAHHKLILHTIKNGQFTKADIK